MTKYYFSDGEKVRMINSVHEKEIVQKAFPGKIILTLVEMENIEDAICDDKIKLPFWDTVLINLGLKGGQDVKE